VRRLLPDKRSPAVKDKVGQRYGSFDRIDSGQDYTLGNVQWVHKVVNRMKMDLGEDEFLKWCGLVVNHKENNVCI
jgi:hypothetical protein